MSPRPRLSATPSGQRPGTPPLPDASLVSARIVATWNEERRERIVPMGGSITVGRGSECELRINDPSVSRKHASIHNDGKALVIRDLGSANSTKVGARKLSQGECAPLPPHAVATLGIVSVRFEPGTDTNQTTGRLRMLEAERMVEAFAKGSMTVLFRGEDGSGKREAAARLHALSLRSERPLVRIEGLERGEAPTETRAERLSEAAIFGYERGAFTGAQETTPGLVESADEGTLFVEEVADLSPAAQVKLLRLIEHGEVSRLGGIRPRPLEVRVLAATSRDLAAMAGVGAFRHDLLARLSVVAIDIPPLRERRGEIPELAERFIEEAAALLDHEPPSLSFEALALLSAYDFPGNIRELRDIIDRAVASAGEGDIEPAHLALEERS